jgi:flap endonuclease-1|tara:strand:- start:1724 stop:2713 length:990 start_codon:yes stop_codon:yes gene_type:complete
MGIKNLTSLIKKHSPDSIQHVGLYTMKDRRVAIDTSIFLYKSLINVRYNGDYLKNKDGKIISHIQGLYYKTVQYLSMGVTPIYIFDGKPPPEKRECIQERINKSEKNKEKMKVTDNLQEKQNLEKGSIRIKKEYIDDLKKLFSLMGVSYIHADGEAEAYASELCRIGYVDAVVTEDMDTLAYGCPVLIRSCIDKSIKRPDAITTFNFQKIIEDLKLTHDEFIDLCILCGCDYCPTIPKIGTVRALKNIQEHKTIEKCLDLTTNPAPPEFLARYQVSRELFKVFKDKIDVDNLPISSSEYNSAQLYTYLVDECSMNKARVHSSLARMRPT